MNKKKNKLGFSNSRCAKTTSSIKYQLIVPSYASRLQKNSFNYYHGRYQLHLNFKFKLNNTTFVSIIVLDIKLDSIFYRAYFFLFLTMFHGSFC